MLPSAVTPATLYLYSLHCDPDSRRIHESFLPFSVHTSKFRSPQLTFFLHVTDTPGVGSRQHQTLPKMERATSNKCAQPVPTPIANPFISNTYKIAGAGTPV